VIDADMVELGDVEDIVCANAVGVDDAVGLEGLADNG